MDKQTEFLMIVQTGLLARVNSRGNLCGRMMHAFIEALFIPLDAIPDDKLSMIRMATEFVEWQTDIHREIPQPEWLKDEWFPDDL